LLYGSGFIPVNESPKLIILLLLTGRNVSSPEVGVDYQQPNGPDITFRSLLEYFMNDIADADALGVCLEIANDPMA
jgi:hypothetical protein